MLARSKVDTIVIRVRQKETYKLMLAYHTPEIVNALAMQQTTSLHVLLILHLIYFQTSQIYCIILREKTLYSNKNDIRLMSMSKKNIILKVIGFNYHFARLYSF